MTMLAASGANAAQIEFWNSEAAKSWTEHQAHLDRLLAPLSRQLLARAAVRKDERVLDVGCGCGDTSLALAEGGAHVTGIDISAQMLDRAKHRAKELKRKIEFHLVDAAEAQFEPVYDLLFSRFGVMFFADPVAAFRNLRGALADGGRMAFLCWQSVAANPWMAMPFAAARAYLPEPPAQDPRAPGPFAFADADYVRSILRDAGFTRIGIEAVSADLVLGSDIEEALTFCARVGPLSRPLAEASKDVRARAIAAVREAFAAHAKGGAVSYGASCWVVTATR